MPLRKILLIAGLVISVLILGRVEHRPVRSAQLQNDLQSKALTFDIDLIQEGDIILRKGDSVLSHLIARNLAPADDMSHCGMIFRVDGRLQVIHTISKAISDIDGIRINTIEDFITEAASGHYCIVRYQKPLGIKTMKSEALHLLKQRVPFDHDFDLETSSHLYCTELIRVLFLKSGEQDFFSKRKVLGKQILDFAPFFNPNHFETVYASKR